jgi:putative transposase
LQSTGQERLPRVLPPVHPHPVRVCSQDASRVGLLTVRRRRLTAPGVQPLGVLQHTCAWCSVDGAVAPATGARCFLARPSLHADMFQRFVDAFAQAFPDRLNLVRWDHRGAHTAQRLRRPEHVRGVWLPPYGPELNPIARVWRDLQDDLAWLQGLDLKVQPVHVGDLLSKSDAPTLQALTRYPDFVEAIHALSA